MIQITVKGLAQFMTANAAQQRKILASFKYPDENENLARTLYYREARDGIRAYHAVGHDPQWLDRQAQSLRGLAVSLGGQSRVRLNNNARAFAQYQAHFAAKTFRILEDKKFSLVAHEVKIKVTPDLHVEERGSEKIIKLEFNVKPPDDEMVKIISQVMFEASHQDGQGLPSSGILYLDVPRGIVHKGARAGARMRGNIDAACQNIAAIWNTI